MHRWDVDHLDEIETVDLNPHRILNLSCCWLLRTEILRRTLRLRSSQSEGLGVTDCAPS